MKYNMPNTLYTKVRQIFNTIKVNIDQEKVAGILIIKLNEGANLRFLVNDRFERKNYIKDTVTLKTEYFSKKRILS